MRVADDGLVYRTLPLRTYVLSVLMEPRSSGSCVGAASVVGLAHVLIHKE